MQASQGSETASARCVLEYGSYSAATFELWSKSLRKSLDLQKRVHQDAAKATELKKIALQEAQKKGIEKSKWITPGHDCKISMLQSEIWCNRVLAGDKAKSESELRRLIAMENLVSQITSDNIVLLVYQKESTKIIR